MPTITLNLCTCPDLDCAERLAKALVQQRLAACVNILPGISSVYAWQGQIEQETEVLLLIKTASEQVQAMTQALAELHPYEVPEIISLPVGTGHLPYIEWVKQCTSP
ncbi:MAG: divalent-cation tolerance protein CutA [Gammaproteobacteria bacterium SHHR-1]|uniref:divalent-cation tolerance protein CutA n=1 Tax=Magnetovirga frankeli TaxID=947516 RepID=UPI0012933F5C|nr:divalent-cation tolerance protein CutA [gamma proteobacterium SS-5]